MKDTVLNNVYQVELYCAKKIMQGVVAPLNSLEIHFCIRENQLNRKSIPNTITAHQRIRLLETPVN